MQISTTTLLTEIESFGQKVETLILVFAPFQYRRELVSNLSGAKLSISRIGVLYPVQ